MAKVRIAFSTHFEIENELAGIGTDNPTNTKQVLGNIHATNAKAVGITTLTTPFEGFVDTKASISGLEGSEQGSLSGEIIIEGSATVSAGATFRSGPENLTVTDSFTLPGISDDKPSAGTTRFNENLGSLEFYTGVEWRAVNSYVDMGNRGRGLFGGRSPSPNQVIDFIHIQTKGDAINFGEMVSGNAIRAGMSNGTRGLFAGGSPNPYTDAIDYIAIASGGNCADFGNLTVARSYSGGVSSSTRGIVLGGYTPTMNDTIDYVEIATTGNALDFGNVTNVRLVIGSCQSPTRGVVGGGYVPSPGLYSNLIEYVTIASKGNTVEFGRLTQRRSSPANGGTGNSTRGIFSGGYTPVHRNVIDYITIASTGNATDFGDATWSGAYKAGVSDQTRVCFGGGFTPSLVKAIDYIQTATTGNALSFGDLTEAGNGPCGVSDSHGGLGGY